MYLFFFKFFSHSGCYVILSRVPCAIQYVFVGYPFYFIFFLYSSVYMSVPNSLTIPPPDSSPLVTISSLSLWVCFCFVNKFICISFFFKILHISDIIQYFFLCLSDFTKSLRFCTNTLRCDAHYVWFYLLPLEMQRVRPQSLPFTGVLRMPFKALCLTNHFDIGAVEKYSQALSLPT